MRRVSAGGGAGRGAPGRAAGAAPLFFSPGCADAPPNVASAKETLNAIAAMRTPKRHMNVLPSHRSNTTRERPIGSPMTEATRDRAGTDEPAR